MMKRLIILFSMIGLLAVPQAVEAQTNLVKDSVVVADSVAAADSVLTEELLVDDEAEVEEGGLHKQLKTKFIDGNVGFIVSLILHLRYPEARIYVIGRNSFKLADFTFAAATYLSSGIPDSLIVDHAFECCGGEGSTSAIDQIIDHIAPEGTVSLMGVSEYPVPINTRMVLEKGLRFYGSSRSGRADFERTMQMHREHPEMAEYLSALVGTVVPVESIRDIATAFDADLRKQMGKTIMEWNM